MGSFFAFALFLAKRLGYVKQLALVFLLFIALLLLTLSLLITKDTANNGDFKWLQIAALVTLLVLAYLVGGFCLATIQHFERLARLFEHTDHDLPNNQAILPQKKMNLSQILAAFEQLATSRIAKDRDFKQSQIVTQATSNNILELVTALKIDTNEQASSNTEQKLIITGVNAAVTQLASTATNISTLSQKVNETANLTAQDSIRIANITATANTQSMQGLQAVERTISVSQEVAAFFQQLVDTLAQLKLKSSSMQRILELLENIASELHLLSLNAAIEAAGAEIYGERFGVIAQEVRNLANRSLKANKEVIQIVQEVKDVIIVTASATNTGYQKIHQMEEVSEQAGDVIRNLLQVSEQSSQQATSINLMAQRVKELTQIINEATQQQRSSSQQVQERLNGLLDIARVTAIGSSTIFEKTTIVQELSYRLHSSLLGKEVAANSFPGLKAETATFISTTSPTKQIVPNKAFRFTMPIEPASLDPIIGSNKESAEIIDQLFDGLTEFDVELNVQPAIASSWQVSPDGLIITYNLRHNARFSNGEQILAADFIYSWGRIIQNSNASQSYLFDDIAGVLEARQQGSSMCQGNTIPGVKALDDYTLEVSLIRPTTNFLAKATLPPFKVVSKANVEQDKTAWTDAGKLVSSGAFVLKDWQHGRQLLLEKNPYYWEDKPGIDTVTVEIVKDMNVARDKYNNQELDMIEVSARDLINVYNIPTLKAQLKIIPRSRANFICFNHQSGPFAGNLELRKAFYQAIDRQALVNNALQRAGVPLYTLLVPGLPTYKLYDAYPFDPVLARASLKAAGYDTPAKIKQLEDLINNYGEDGKSGGFAYTTERPGWQEASENYVQQIYEHLGLKLKTNPISTFQEFEQRRSYSRDFLLYFGSWGTDYPDPANFYQPLFGGQNKAQLGGGYSNSKFDELCLAGATEVDLAQRALLYQQAEKLLQDDAAFVPTYCSVYLLLIKPHLSKQLYGPMGLTLLKRVQITR